jgi:hypothetical protein
VFRRTGRGIFSLAREGTHHSLRLADKGSSQHTGIKHIPGSRTLVLGYLERIASRAFSEFPRQITNLVHGKHGVYALYKGDHLYYVGLATNLRTRIKQHLRDKHAGKWSRFSLYLVRKVEHIKELESMILRIADPTGNSTRGGLPGAENLWGKLHGTIREAQECQLQTIFDIKSKPTAIRPINRKQRSIAARTTKRNPALAQFSSHHIKQIRGRHKGQVHIARVNPDGSIQFAGKAFNSPSLAGAAAVKRKTCNGWTFWEYERAPGDWVKLDALRK